MEIREALEYVVGELVVDKQHTYLSRLVIEDLLARSEGIDPWRRYLALETVVALMHRTDDRYNTLKAELQTAKKKHRSKIDRQRKKILKGFST